MSDMGGCTQIILQLSGINVVWIFTFDPRKMIDFCSKLPTIAAELQTDSSRHFPRMAYFSFNACWQLSEPPTVNEENRYEHINEWLPHGDCETTACAHLKMWLFPLLRFSSYISCFCFHMSAYSRKSGWNLCLFVRGLDRSTRWF